ncbi:MAG: hypothetical protein M3Y33_18260 [Actinomycetota bacterium]|nr:hypothetical protein [Actinomycetota bacterium]
MAGTIAALRAHDLGHETVVAVVLEHQRRPVGSGQETTSHHAGSRK